MDRSRLFRLLICKSSSNTMNSSTLRVPNWSVLAHPCSGIRIANPHGCGKQLGQPECRSHAQTASGPQVARLRPWESPGATRSWNRHGGTLPCWGIWRQCCTSGHLACGRRLPRAVRGQISGSRDLWEDSPEKGAWLPQSTPMSTCHVGREAPPWAHGKAGGGSRGGESLSPAGTRTRKCFWQSPVPYKVGTRYSEGSGTCREGYPSFPGPGPPDSAHRSFWLSRQHTVSLQQHVNATIYVFPPAYGLRDFCLGPGRQFCPSGRAHLWGAVICPSVLHHPMAPEELPILRVCSSFI